MINQEKTRRYHKQIMKKLLKITMSCIFIFLTMILAIGCGSTEKVESSDQGQRPGMQSRQRNPEEIKTSLAGLVKEGTISQKQADSVAAYFEKRASERKNMTGEDRKGRLEQNQRSNQGQNQGQGQRQRPNPLRELVDNGTITQEQADKITEALFQQRGTGQPAE